MAPASPDRKLALRTGMTPCVKCLLVREVTEVIVAVSSMASIQPPNMKSSGIIFSMVSADPKSKNNARICTLLCFRPINR